MASETRNLTAKEWAIAKKAQADLINLENHVHLILGQIASDLAALDPEFDPEGPATFGQDFAILPRKTEAEIRRNLVGLRQAIDRKATSPESTQDPRDVR